MVLLDDTNPPAFSYADRCWHEDVQLKIALLTNWGYGFSSSPCPNVPALAWSAVAAQEASGSKA